MEREAPKSTYEHSLDFYHRQISEYQERMNNLPENDVWGTLDAMENLELAQLKLSHIERRHEAGLIK